MSLTARLASEIVRQRLGWPETKAAAIINQIPEALKATARKVAADPYLRDLMLTDKTVAQIALSNGRVNLAPNYDEYYFLKEYLDLGQIYYLPSATFVATPGTDFIDVDLDVSNNDIVRFTTTGTLPAGLDLNTSYYVRNFTAGTPPKFQVSLTLGGAVIDITNTGSGTHTATLFDSFGSPIQFLPAAQLSVLPRFFDADFTYAYLQGDMITMGDRALTGNLGFAVPSYPITLESLPESDEIERMFLQKLFELMSGGDAAEDNEN